MNKLRTLSLVIVLVINGLARPAAAMPPSPLDEGSSRDTRWPDSEHGP